MVGKGTSNSGNAHCNLVATETGAGDGSLLTAAGVDVGDAARDGMLGGTPSSGVGHAMSIDISGISVLGRTSASETAAFGGAAFCCAVGGGGAVGGLAGSVAVGGAAFAAISGAAFSAAIFCETDLSTIRPAAFCTVGR